MFMTEWQEFLPHLPKLLAASFFGGLIGFERDMHGRAAGLRTHLLVSLGAAVFMILSYEITNYGTGPARDPGRIAAQVVTGIGFLGAGAIIKQGFTIRGLTTASCLWIVAGVGMASGLGKYFLAGTSASVALVALVVLHRFEKVYPRDSYRVITLTTSNNVASSQVVDLVKRNGVKIIFFDFERDYETKRTTFTISIRIFQKGISDKLVHAIVKDLERAAIPLHKVTWDHREGV